MDFAKRELRDKAIAAGRWEDAPTLSCDAETETLQRFVDMIELEDLSSVPAADERAERERRHVTEWFAELRESVERLLDPGQSYVPLGPVYAERLTDPVAREVYERELERVVCSLMQFHPKMRHLADDIARRRNPSR